MALVVSRALVVALVVLRALTVVLLVDTLKIDW